MWGEVKAELELEGVRLVSPDAEALSSIVQESVEKAKHVFLLQQSIIDQKEQEDLQQEKHAYEEVKDLFFFFWVHTFVTLTDPDCLLLFVVDVLHADQLKPQAARAYS